MFNFFSTINVLLWSPFDDSPDDWITIDPSSGSLKVLANRAIGCDVPKRDDLEFVVRLFDGDNETLGRVSRSFLKIEQ